MFEHMYEILVRIVHVYAYFSSEDSGESVQTRSLARAFFSR